MIELLETTDGTWVHLLRAEVIRLPFRTNGLKMFQAAAA